MIQLAMSVDESSIFPISGRGPRSSQVRMLTLIVSRWASVLGQALTLLTVNFTLGIDLPLTETLGVVGFAAAINAYLSVRYRAAQRLGEWATALHLGFDILQLTAMLYLTGGLLNPFSLLYLVPVTISAAILSRRATFLLGFVAIVCTTFLAYQYQPLIWKGQPFAGDPLYISGVWVALLVGMTFISFYTWLVAAESRRMADALIATQLALSREQRLTALDGLAAAAAHELGTPLGTITLVAKDLEEEIGPDSPLFEDVKLLVSEVGRCREILARLSSKPEGDSPDLLAETPVPALLDEALAPLGREGVAIHIYVDPLHDEAPPLMPRRPEIIHGLRNLVHNAVDFAKSHVSVAVGWSDAQIQISINDDGPGFPPEVLDGLGEPYISGRTDGGGMGLGVFIAKTLLGRTGALVTFANRPNGGAEVVVLWSKGVKP